MRPSSPALRVRASALTLALACSTASWALDGGEPAPTAATQAGVPQNPGSPAARPAPAPSHAPGAPAPAYAPCAAEAGRAEKPDPDEQPIPVPVPVPVGFMVAWKPMLLSVRVDAGERNTFGSDKLQLLRAIARYTHLFDEFSPFAGRLEIEGGQFQTDDQNLLVGSNGADVTFRALVGASTKVSSSWNILGSIGAITRYQWGKPSGGAPTIGSLGVVANSELEFRILPAMTLVLFGEVGLLPFPYFAQKNLGDLSDSSEFKGRVQLSVDLTQIWAIDLGFEFTRWHSAFTRSTILGNLNPDRALLIDAREHQVTLGIRWKK